MAKAGNADSRREFARAFGDRLKVYLQENGIRQNDAAMLLGLENKHGKPSKARLNSYCHDSPSGKRPAPNAEILYLACTRLPDFYFDYRGKRINATTINGHGTKRPETTAEQLTLHFDRQFNLTDDAGRVTVMVKRPPGRIELSVSVDAKA